MKLNYLQYIGGFTAKEAVNLCFKEVMENQTTTVFTWFGREENSLPLYNTRIIKAIYDALSDNKHFEKPTRSEFQRYMREALRAAKQRQRTYNRKKENRNRNKERNAVQEYWADEDNSLDSETDERTKLIRLLSFKDVADLGSLLDSIVVIIIGLIIGFNSSSFINI